MKARWLLGAPALVAGAALCGALLTSCEPDFEPSNKLTTLRVLAVRADNPYPKPGSTVHFDMLWYDGKSPPDEPRKSIQILWVAGCFDPSGDLYYACYPEFGKLFDEKGMPRPESIKYFGAGDSFNLEIPADIVSRRPPREGVHPYGVTFVFFAVCAGQIKPTAQTASSALPLGCFDEQGNALTADDFVPGYLNLYSYEDRTNQNPVVTGFSIGSSSFPETGEIPDTHLPGCNGKKCSNVHVKALVDQASAEIDEGGTDDKGNPLKEMLWVDYYTSVGTLAKSARLVNDSTKGWNDDLGVDFTPQASGQTGYVFAVVHDNRGGIGWVKRRVVGD
jgi:hypothetical protein